MFLKVQDLIVYQRLCDLHLEVCDLASTWPDDEKYELASQIRRSSNSAPAQLAEKHSDRHLRNKIEGVNRCRTEASETIHHLFIALKKEYVTDACFQSFRERYEECIRMLNGMERTLEQHLPTQERRWPASRAKLNPEP